MKRSRSSGRMREAFSLIRILLVAFMTVAIWQIGRMATAAIGQVVFGMAIMLTAEIVIWFVVVNTRIAHDSRRQVPRRWHGTSRALAHDGQRVPDLPPVSWPSQDKAIQGYTTLAPPRWESPRDKE